jgi:hypothetical protein
MTLSSPTLPTRGSSGSEQSSAAKPRRARGSMDSTASSSSSASSSVLRVSKEVENIGARVPLSKKRLKLDGRRLHSSDQYAASWHYDFSVGKDPSTPFRVVIRDAKSSVVDQGRLETLYELVADGVHWEQLSERFLPVAHRHHMATVWSSDMYVRRVEDTRGQLLSDGDERPPGTLLTWTFAFGVNGGVHKLELRDLEKGEFVVVLDCRELKRVDFDEIQGDMWEFEYDLEDQHELDLVVTLVDDHKTYDFFIDGSAWNDISQTNFVLESGWYPVYSRSRSAVYFRHEGTGNTQWEKPTVNRDDARASRPLQEFEQVSPGSQGLDDLLHGVHAVAIKEEAHEEPESEHEQAPQLVSMKQPLQSVQEVPEGPEAQEANLIDFSDVAVHSSPSLQPQGAGYDGFDPFNPATHAHFVHKDQRGQQKEQPVDLLSL